MPADLAPVLAIALAGIPAAAFVAGLSAGNALFVGAHFGLGFVFGEPVVGLVGGALGPLAIAAVGLAAIGGAGWLALGRRRRRAAAAMPIVLAWADACCPACLAAAGWGSRLTG